MTENYLNREEYQGPSHEGNKKGSNTHTNIQNNNICDSYIFNTPPTFKKVKTQ